MENKEQKYFVLWEALKRGFVFWVCTIGIMLVFGTIMDKIETKMYADLLSWKVLLDHSLSKSWRALDTTIFITGMIGVPVHECSHFIACKLFRFKVAEVKLFRPFDYKLDGILGYVLYETPSNGGMRVEIGNFFVSIAPMLIGAFVMWLMIRLILPEAYKTADKYSDDVWMDGKRGKAFRASFAFLRGFAKGIGTMRGWSFLRIPVCLYLTTSIAMHMTYSSVDLDNGMTGLYVTLIVYFFIGLVSALFFRKKYLDFALDIGMLLVMLFTFGVLTKLMVWGILRLIVYT